MKRTLTIASLVALLGLAGLGATGLAPISTAQAADEVTLRTHTFLVENMTCAVCPITVRSAMKRLEGVRSVKVDREAKTATVTFDPALTTANDIARASADAGYPAMIVES
ncbi:MAG: heavy metal-associated domain-containing protein [Proteobacteria bacterium]|nr:heavy metal-associated domain-containing protein [Pseudomonadota bacterium]MDA1057054.1 heavy metal-associated domain-containing protein [Pseudomonadota bacterium]